jgi:MFS transporter, OFA family, oxalate/formate antiporter
VYAWSVFRIPLTKAFGCTISQVTFAFTLALLMLGFAAFAGGLWMRKPGPRRVAIAAGILYGAGVFPASLSAGGLHWLYFFQWISWRHRFGPGLDYASRDPW